jgi:hypothetical protein
MLNRSNGKAPLVLAWLPLLSAPAIASDGVDIPPEAKAAIERVRVAAQSRDFKTLKDNMLKTSRLYFGSQEVDTDEVLSEWKRRPDYFLVHLTNVLSNCHSMPRDRESRVDCDGPPGEIFRALFLKVGDTWKMHSMISGD